MTNDLKIKRKLRKLARRLAEANTWKDSAQRKTFADFVDVWSEAFQLIKLTGDFAEFENRERQLHRLREQSVRESE